MHSKKLFSGSAAVFGALLCIPLTAPRASAQNYATILYETWANGVVGSSGTYNGDVADMMTEPNYTGGYNWWGKPLYAATHGDGTIKNNYLFYFGDQNTPNTGLIDYHADLLSKANMDFITIDFTNGALSQIVEGAQALCSRYAQRASAGTPTPRIAFFVDNAATLQTVYNTFYSGQYPSSLFFTYLGKPLALVGTPNTSLSAGDVSQPYAPSGGIFDSFTCRHCWGLNNSGSFWQFKTSASTPPAACQFNGRAEEMGAAFACQSSYMTTDGVNPAPGAQGRANGAFFNTYLAAAQQTRPTFTFITGWNEWASINFNTPPAGEFVDQWKENYSADAEPEASTDPGGHGYQYYDLLAEQVGRLKGTFPVISGRAYRIVNQNSGLNVDDQNFSTVQGFQMQQWTQNGSSAQNWTFTDLNNGYWEITNGSSGQVLEVSGGSTADSAPVGQWPWVGGTNQQWSLRPVGDGSWLIVNRNSGLVLAIASASTSPGAKTTQFHDNGTPDHNWRFEDASGVFSGDYYTLTNVGSSLALDDPGGAAVSGTQIQIWTPNGSAAQKWLFAPQPDGSYALTNQAGGLRLDDPASSHTAGTILQLYYANNTPAQNWTPHLQTDGSYTLTNVTAGLNLDDPNGAGPAGTKVQLWGANGLVNQEWRLTRQ